MLLPTLQLALAASPPPAADPRFAWIAAIESGPPNTTHRLKPQTYFIDRQYLLPHGTQLVGAGSGAAAGGTRIVAVGTKPAQKGGHFHGCGPNHVNRIGFVLGSRCRIASLHYVGIERARYPDSHPMCGGKGHPLLDASAHAVSAALTRRYRALRLPLPDSGLRHAVLPEPEERELAHLRRRPRPRLARGGRHHRRRHGAERLLDA